MRAAARRLAQQHDSPRPRRSLRQFFNAPRSALRGKNTTIQVIYETANSQNRNQSNLVSSCPFSWRFPPSSFGIPCLFDIHLFVFGWSPNPRQKNKLARICGTEIVTGSHGRGMVSVIIVKAWSALISYSSSFDEAIAKTEFSPALSALRRDLTKILVPSVAGDVNNSEAADGMNFQRNSPFVESRA
jgi:hypothetical protein